MAAHIARHEVGVPFEARLIKWRIVRASVLLPLIALSAVSRKALS